MRIRNSGYWKFYLFSLNFSLIFYLCCWRKPMEKEYFQSDFESRLSGPLVANDPDVIQYLKTKYLQRPSSKPYALSTNPFYKKDKNSYSWPHIHTVIKKIFQGQPGGFFVEAGALDGEFLSNTLWLERELNWTGLLVEPDPYNYKELLKKNRKAWTSNTCLSKEPYPEKTILVSLKGTKGKTFQKPWVLRGASHDIRVKRSDDSLSNQFYAKATSSYLIIQCFPLFSYLLALNKRYIDLISLDIQGFEWNVLKHFPFENMNVKVFIVEHSEIETLDLKFKNFFENKGYKLIYCRGEPDYIFLHVDEFIQNNFSEVNECHRG